MLQTTLKTTAKSIKFFSFSQDYQALRNETKVVNNDLLAIQVSLLGSEFSAALTMTM